MDERSTAIRWTCGDLRCGAIVRKVSDDPKKISVLYLRYDDRQIAGAIYEQMVYNNTENDINAIGGNDFAFIQKSLSLRAELPIDVVILHLMAGCHELDYRECDENFSTGLRRAEILREQGYDGKIILLTTNDTGRNRRLIRNFDERVKKADVTFCGYHDGFQMVVDAIRRAARPLIQ